MGKNKLLRFRENETFSFLYQPGFDEVWKDSFSLRGRWHVDHFSNSHPITLELGCGRGEYTVAMAAAAPQENFVGMDIKGARLWVGAKAAVAHSLSNVAFVRARIETLISFFAPGEVANLWLTFPDPQLKDRRAKKRLTNLRFLQQYARSCMPIRLRRLRLWGGLSIMLMSQLTESWMRCQCFGYRLITNDIFATVENRLPISVSRCLRRGRMPRRSVLRRHMISG